MARRISNRSHVGLLWLLCGGCSVCFAVEGDELPDLKKEPDLPIIPNYLAHPPFPYVYNSMSDSIPDPAVNGSISHLDPYDASSSSLPAVQPGAHAALQPGSVAAQAAAVGDAPSLPRGCAAPPHAKPGLQRGPLYQGSVSWRSPPSSAGSTQSVPQQENGSCLGPVPAFQPLFFTGTFPLNMQGKVKVSPLFVLELLSSWRVRIDWSGLCGFRALQVPVGTRAVTRQIS